VEYFDKIKNETLSIEISKKITIPSKKCIKIRDLFYRSFGVEGENSEFFFEQNNEIIKINKIEYNDEK